MYMVLGVLVLHWFGVSVWFSDEVVVRLGGLVGVWCCMHIGGFGFKVRRWLALWQSVLLVFAYWVAVSGL